MNRIIFSLMAAALLIGSAPSALFAENGVAVMEATSPGGEVQGEVTFSETDEGLKVHAEFKGAPAGEHGFHIHEFGTCGNEGKDAGAHYNPTSAPHGYLPDHGLEAAHAGDLGNIEINEDGTGSLDVTLPSLTLAAGEYTVAGRSVVLHAEDDKFTQPAGDAGGRIACGTIALSKEMS